MPQQTDSIEACLQERADAELVALCFIMYVLSKVESWPHRVSHFMLQPK